MSVSAKCSTAYLMVLRANSPLLNITKSITARKTLPTEISMTSCKKAYCARAKKEGEALIMTSYQWRNRLVSYLNRPKPSIRTASRAWDGVFLGLGIYFWCGWRQRWRGRSGGLAFFL